MEPFSQVELQLAARNHGMPLEALRYPVTPVGLHYLLTHYDIPFVDPREYRLDVCGTPLTLDELRARPAVELEVTMECAGNGRALLGRRPLSQPWLNEAVGTARWRGTPLRPLLEETAKLDGAVEVVFTGADLGYEAGEEQSFERSLPVAEAMRDDVLLVYEMNGAPLAPQHGFPLRLVVPGWYGMASVKWLTRIALADEPFGGYQQASAYRLKLHDDDPGTPLTRILPRALMVPPGVPDFPTRERTLRGGRVTLEGRAWSGFAPVADVSVSTDGGSTWNAAEVEPSLGGYAWRGWSYEWDATPGEHVLCCRARDEAGNEQPLEPTWNVGGYANNAVQRLPIRVV